MKIGIIGYDIFGTGGTRRSNLNLINEFSMHGDEVIFFNLLPFGKKQVKNIQSELEKPKNVSFYLLQHFPDVVACNSYILTRESLFSFARYIKFRWPEAVVVGEVHAPLDLIDPELDLGIDAVDVYRVATEKIKKRFIKRIKQNNVVSFPISGRHIDFSNKKIDGLTDYTNFLVYSRFDEEQKDIHYSIRLINYLVHVLGKKKVRLYLNGTGKSEDFYKKLIKYYELTEYVFINQVIPDTAIYLSTARFETLGYSIMEAFAAGKRTVVYSGDDGSLADIYAEFKSICWLKKDVIADAEAIFTFLKKSELQQQYDFEHDLLIAKEMLCKSNYAEDYLLKVVGFQFSKNLVGEKVDFNTLLKKIKQENNLSGKSFITKFFLKAGTLPLIGKFFKSSSIKGKIRKILNRFRKIKLRTNPSISSEEVRHDFFFIESFQGLSFAGDPKYFALEIKKKIPEAFIYVSSVNELSDSEIMSYGFYPVRSGSERYIHKFRKSAVIVINESSIEKLDKLKGQKFIQTWHGLPLKKIGADLPENRKKKKEIAEFVFQMKKWDYILSSSKINTEIFSSAFLLKENKKIEILENGVPRNSYLLKYKNDSNERMRLMLKYFNKPYDGEKKYILYCPIQQTKMKSSLLSGATIKKILEDIPEKYEFIVKFHPRDYQLVLQYQKIDSRIHCFFNESTDIQELFLLSDILITDYSSALIDYSHLDRKIILIGEDPLLNGKFYDFIKEENLNWSNSMNDIDKRIETDSNSRNKISEKIYEFDKKDSSEIILKKIFFEG